MSDRWRRAAHSALDKAAEQGEFDDLAGKGKKLDLGENPFARPEDELAHRLLRDQGFTLPWIEARREIEKALEAERARLARAWEFGAPARWRPERARFSEAIQAINRLVRDYNLKVPLAALQMLPFDAEREIARITGRGEGQASG